MRFISIVFLITFFAQSSWAQKLSISTNSGKNGICAGDSIELIASDSTKIQYTWILGNDTLSSHIHRITVSLPGVYFLYTGSDTAFFQVIRFNTPPRPIIYVNAQVPKNNTDFICKGTTAFLSSSQSPPTLKWNTGESSQDIFAGNSGTYQVTYTDPNGCSISSLPLTINLFPVQNPPIITSIGKNPFCDGDSLSLVSNILNQIQWFQSSDTINPIDTHATIRVKKANGYYVSYTDINKCIWKSSVYSVSVYSKPNVSILGSHLICLGDTSFLTTNILAKKYLWNTGDTSAIIAATKAGNYSVSITDSNSCTNDGSHVLMVDSPLNLQVIPSGNTTFCEGGSVDLTANIPSVLWNNSSSNHTLSISKTGTYFFKKSNACGTFYSDTVSVLVHSNPSIPTITVVGDTAFCNGDSTVLVANPGNSILWNDGDTVFNKMIKKQGTYSVTYTDPATGCFSVSASRYIQVSSPIQAKITANGKTKFCAGDSVILTTVPNYSITWNDLSHASSRVIKKPGTYWIKFVDPFSLRGCSSTSTSITISVDSLPIAPSITIIGDTVFCEGDSTHLISSSNLYNTWNTGAISKDIWAKSSDFYYVAYTDPTTQCSSPSVPVQVQVIPLPLPNVITSNKKGICGNEPLTLSTNCPFGGYWDNDTSKTQKTLIVSVPGTHQFYAKNSFGCTSESKIFAVTKYNIPPKPSIYAKNDTIHSSSKSGNQWYRDSFGIIAGAHDSVFVATNTGRYFVVVTDSNGCSNSSDTIFVIRTGTKIITQDQWMVYPNPTTDMVYGVRPKYGLKTDLTLFNGNGQLIYHTSLPAQQNNFELDLSEWPKGFYFLKINNQYESKVMKLILQ